MARSTGREIAGAFRKTSFRRVPHGRGLLPLRPVLFACIAAALGSSGGALHAAPPALVAPADPLRAAMVDHAGKDLRAFYAARGWRPVWIAPDGAPRAAIATLLGQVEAARTDGLSPSRLKARDLRRAFERFDPADAESGAKLELAASRVYAAWVKALRAAPHGEMQYESEALAPVVPTTEAALSAAASARSLEEFVSGMGWMHPLYAPLRAALTSPDRTDPERRLLARNLERVRALPSAGAGRYVLVDAAGARLWMYDNGRAVDSMKVVVGKPDNPTPLMAGFLRAAILNPYWNVPDDLVRGRIATNVIDRGIGYLSAQGYQVLSGWDDDAAPLDPSRLDWTAIAAGQQHVRVRQLPGSSNFMGRVKFVFPNPEGIYLHDTPDKELMRKDARTYSSGCVRLEDAPRLGRWLLGKPLPRKVATPEQPVALPEPVPVYITYLTAFPVPAGRGTPPAIAFRADPYRRDGGMMGAPAGGILAAR